MRAERATMQRIVSKQVIGRLRASSGLELAEGQGFKGCYSVEQKCDCTQKIPTNQKIVDVQVIADDTHSDDPPPTPPGAEEGDLSGPGALWVLVTRLIQIIREEVERLKGVIERGHGGPEYAA
jgi:hypothetical protein